jgi:ATP-dependent Clp endopeptidase proteolytic subunit ClpP
VKEIMLYDEIGPSYYGLLDGKWMVDQLREASGQPVRVRVNSPGGSVFEGQAMYSALAAYTPGVIVQIDALAASAASFVAMAASRIEIAANAMVMIHNAWGATIGGAAQHEKAAAMLRKIDDQLVEQYSARTKQDKEKIREWMAAETWMTAEEAVKNGFADAVGQQLAVKACVRDGMFARTPRELLSAAASVSPNVAAAAMRRRLALARASC